MFYICWDLHEEQCSSDIHHQRGSFTSHTQSCHILIKCQSAASKSRVDVKCFQTDVVKISARANSLTHFTLLILLLYTVCVCVCVCVRVCVCVCSHENVFDEQRQRETNCGLQGKICERRQFKMSVYVMFETVSLQTKTNTIKTHFHCVWWYLLLLLGTKIFYTFIQMSLIPFSKHDVASSSYLFLLLFMLPWQITTHQCHYIHSDGTFNAPLIYQ